MKKKIILMSLLVLGFSGLSAVGNKINDNEKYQAIIEIKDYEEKEIEKEFFNWVEQSGTLDDKFDKKYRKTSKLWENIIKKYYSDAEITKLGFLIKNNDFDGVKEWIETYFDNNLAQEINDLFKVQLDKTGVLKKELEEAIDNSSEEEKKEVMLKVAYGLLALGDIESNEIATSFPGSNSVICCLSGMRMAYMGCSWTTLGIGVFAMIALYAVIGIYQPIWLLINEPYRLGRHWSDKILSFIALSMVMAIPPIIGLIACGLLISCVWSCVMSCMDRSISELELDQESVKKIKELIEKNREFLHQLMAKLRKKDKERENFSLE